MTRDRLLFGPHRGYSPGEWAALRWGAVAGALAAGVLSAPAVVTFAGVLPWLLVTALMVGLSAGHGVAP